MYKVLYVTHVRICTYVRMYVCTHVHMLEQLDVQMYSVSCVHVVIHTHVRMYASMHGNK